MEEKELAMNYKYWEPGDYILLENARNYYDLQKIAMSVIERMPQPVIQVCGPISTGGLGSVEKNLELFEVTIENLSKEGVKIFNQIPFEVPIQNIRSNTEQAGYDMDLLNQFYLPLFESGHISEFYFLPDWQTSFGSKWEHEQAERLGIKILYL